MPESSLWTLVVSLAVLAFGLVLKVANLTHRLNLAEHEVSRFLTEIADIKKKHDAEISDVSKLHDGRQKELADKYIHKIELLQDALTGSGKLLGLGLGSLHLLEKEKRA